MPAVLSACGPGEGGTDPKKMMPKPTFLPDVVGKEVEGFEQSLSTEAADFATILTDGRVLVQTGANISLVEGSTVTPLLADTGALKGAVEIGSGVLLGAEKGFFSLDSSGIVLSPLSDQLSGGASSLQYVPNTGDLWIASGNGLARWRNQQIFQISSSDLPTQGAQVAYGAPINGNPAVWVVSGGKLYGLQQDQDTWKAYPQLIEEAVELAVDATGRLWVRTQKGALHSLKAGDSAFKEHDAVTQVSRVIASQASEDVWIEDQTGLFLYEKEEFHPVKNAPSGTLIAKAGAGGILMSTPTGLVRFFDRLRVELRGLKAGDYVDALRRVQIAPLLPEQVQSVEVRLSDTTISVSSRPWMFSLDPTKYPDGQHRLTVKVQYRGNLPQAELTIEVSVFGQPPSWAGQVEPLYRDSCALCHNAQGSARILETRTAWVSEFELILDNVRNGRMPLPPKTPLSPAQITMLEAWKSAGFPE